MRTTEKRHSLRLLVIGAALALAVEGLPSGLSQNRRRVEISIQP
jgi:hypothetical protein